MVPDTSRKPLTAYRRSSRKPTKHRRTVSPGARRNEVTAMSTFARKPDESSELQAADPRLDLWFSQRGRRWDFSRMELEELVQALAARPHLWEHLVKHSTSERFYVQLHLDDTLEVWLICWSQQQDTGFHDHNGSRGAVAVTDGSLEERRLALGGRPHLRSCTAADQCSRSAQATSTTSVRAVPPWPRRFTPTRPPGCDGFLRVHRKRPALAARRRRGRRVLLISNHTSGADPLLSRVDPSRKGCHGTLDT